MQQALLCPKCNTLIRKHAQPAPTADIILYDEQYGIVFIERVNPPLGYALPGGFIDMNESVETAAIREMKEETNLDIELIGILGVYSKPDRDPRFHTMSTTFVAKTHKPEELKAGDDAKKAQFYSLNKLPKPLCFDHQKMIDDFLLYLQNKRNLCQVQ